MPKTAPKAMAKPAGKTPPAKNSKSAKKDAAPGTLAKTLVDQLPASTAIMAAARDIAEATPRIGAQFEAARKKGAIPAARAYVVMHRMKERLEEILKPLNEIIKTAKEVSIPEALEAAGVPSVTLEEGFRVGTSVRTVASIKPGQKEAAIEWLQGHDKADIVQETINSSTLSAFAKECRENNIDLPDDLFNVAFLNNTSVTKT